MPGFKYRVCERCGERIASLVLPRYEPSILEKLDQGLPENVCLACNETLMVDVQKHSGFEAQRKTLEEK